jgi:hypothetical protein
MAQKICITNIRYGGAVQNRECEETRPPFCTVVHFMYILMDPDPN